MNDGLLRVSFGALRQASADIDRALAALRNQLDQLERDAVPLVSTWSGTARDAYEQRQNTWRAASEDLQGILRQIKAALDESVIDYAETERVATQRFQ
ncbi:WXG100 family type VII secretion target [Actinoplanes missouriensis]|uniref:WXG100 family type VII secretion target n=1 Tax=Actinoplanes missouriensis TaxID=1866 RepID=UPI0033DE2DEF